MMLVTTLADIDVGDLSDAYDLIRDRRLRSEERWTRLGTGALCIAGIFAATTVHGIWIGDDLAGLVMTAVPGAAMLGFWAYARLRVAQIVEGRRPTIVQRAVSWALIAAAIAVVAFAPRSESRSNDDHANVQTPVFVRDLDIGYIPGPRGVPMRSLVRKSEATQEGCPDRWRQFAPPNEHLGYCDHGLAPPPR